MILTLELTPEDEAKLRTEAAQSGLPLPAYALRLLLGNGPQAPLSPIQVERRALIESLQGRFAHIPTTVEDFHREKQAEIAREEAR